MKLSVNVGASSLALLFACFACSACSSDGSSSDGGGQAAGASSGAGPASSGGSTVVTGTGGGGTVDLEPVTSAAGQPEVANGECAQQNFVLSSKPADVLLVLDRSKSMIEHTVPPMGQTRWDAVVQGMTSVITATDSVVSWGLKLFPEGEGSECLVSSVSEDVAVQIAPRNAAAVNGIITGTMALGNGTPTGDAILKAAAYLQSRKASNQFMVLATDGQPSCPSGSDAALKHAVSALSAAQAAGFPTYVIGVLDPDEDESSFPRLNAMAEAGGTARSDDPDEDKFYQAYSQDELSQALEAVTGQVVSCVFSFDAPPPDATNINVKINGRRIERDTSKTQGWDYTDGEYTGLELYGDACREIRDAGENQVDIVFGCKGVPIR